MEYTEEEYLMISGIQHFKFCRRQWALIHIEQQWEENVHTVVGELMHKKAHDPYLKEKRKDTLIVRALPVSSRTLGVSGECDIVEFHKCEDVSGSLSSSASQYRTPDYRKHLPATLQSVHVLLQTPSQRVYENEPLHSSLCRVYRHQTDIHALRKKPYLYL